MPIETNCPRCRTPLTKGTLKNDIDSWACPNHHGVGITLSEAWGHLQDDEVKAIWSAAKNGQPSDLKSPALGKEMVRIEITVDSDEEEGNRGPDAFQIELDVSVDEQFIWFDAGELEKMPEDIPNPQMSEGERKHIEEIAQEFGDSMMANYDKRENESVTGKLYNFVASHRRMKRFIEAILPGKNFPDAKRI
jgi:Zn-finger nucleic acid-binding protein